MQGSGEIEIKKLFDIAKNKKFNLAKIGSGVLTTISVIILFHQKLLFFLAIYAGL